MWKVPRNLPAFFLLGNSFKPHQAAGWEHPSQPLTLDLWAQEVTIPIMPASIQVWLAPSCPPGLSGRTHRARLTHHLQVAPASWFWNIPTVLSGRAPTAQTDYLGCMSEVS